MTTSSRFWADWTTLDFERLRASGVAARTIAVLPVAATEQHGPHLPLSVDTVLVDGIVNAALDHLPVELPVLILPTQSVGLSPEHARFPGAQDRLSVLAQLAALVASAPQGFSPGTTLQVQTIGPRSADLWLFTFGNMETLELPGGTQQGLKLVRQPRQMYDQKLEVWLAPGLAYLPARIRITEANGDYVDQKWEASEATVSP